MKSICKRWGCCYLSKELCRDTVGLLYGVGRLGIAIYLNGVAGLSYGALHLQIWSTSKRTVSLFFWAFCACLFTCMLLEIPLGFIVTVLGYGRNGRRFGPFNEGPPMILNRIINMILL